MKILLSLVLAGLLFSCKGESVSNQTDYSQKFHIESAKKALTMARAIRQGETLTEADWTALFESPGYEAYTCSSMEFKRDMVRTALTNVFDPALQSVEDSILALPMSGNLNDLKILLHQNFNNLEGQLPQVEQFLEDTDFAALMKKGDSISRTFLPENLQDERPELFETHFVLMEPDAYVQDCGMIVDVNNAFNNGTDNLIKLFSHEYHHVYYGLMVKGYNHPLLKQLEDLHKEGLADLVDKPIAPFKTMLGYPQFFVNFYNQEYSNTPQKLKQLDSLVNTALEEKWSDDDLAISLEGYFAFGGHPNGYYMAHLIREEKGIDTAINTFSDIVKFFEEYNAIAAADPQEYELSNTFMAFITSIRDAELAEASQYSDTVYEVNITVTVPNADDEVFIAGNQQNLGDWDPGQVQFNKVSDLERSITLSLIAPAEFKFTRGSWKTEGFVKDKARGPNLRLGFEQDTTVTYVIEAWADTAPGK